MAAAPETARASPRARERLLLAAERLIAEQGPSVPLRAIAAEARQRNNSAVNYHFHDRDGLITALLDLRTAAMEQSRLQELAQRDLGQGTVQDLVRLLVLPTVTEPYRQGATHYARCVEQLRWHPVVRHGLQDPQRWPATRIITRHLMAQLLQLPPDRRAQRISSAISVMFALAADRERDGAEGRAQGDPEELVGMLSALLLA